MSPPFRLAADPTASRNGLYGVAVALVLQRAPHRRDATVHHVGRGDDVGARVGVRQGLAHQHVDGFVVQHVARVVDDAVLSMRRVGVERDVGHDGETGQLRLDRAHRPLHETLRVGAFGPVGALQVGIDDREQGDGGNAERFRPGELGQQAVDGLARDTGHRRHVLDAALAVQDERRVDEICAG